jgi:glycosyltransferase involved in cell wall biosynthesis
MLLSLLILTTPRRRSTFMQKILEQVESQVHNCGRDDVEILCLYDNKKRSVGEKRNAVLSLAQGRFFAFIDDDDRIADTYVKDILAVIAEKPETDVVVFDVEYKPGGGPAHVCLHGVEYNIETKRGIYYRKPAHIHVWRRDLVKDIHFPSFSNGEDMDWCKKACLLVKKQERISKVLYYYDFSVTVTETQLK